MVMQRLQAQEEELHSLWALLARQVSKSSELHPHQPNGNGGASSCTDAATVATVDMVQLGEPELFT